MSVPPRQTLLDDLQYLDDWQDRYRYLIELGKQLPPLPEADKVDENLVRGCMSRVWLCGGIEPSAALDPNTPPRLQLRADSDALIVRGLVALLLALYADRTPADAAGFDAGPTLASLGLAQHLSRGRSEGLQAMAQRIRALASQATPA